MVAPPKFLRVLRRPRPHLGRFVPKCEQGPVYRKGDQRVLLLFGTLRNPAPIWPSNVPNHLACRERCIWAYSFLLSCYLNRCAFCGGRATEFDHVHGSPYPKNPQGRKAADTRWMEARAGLLRATCHACNGRDGSRRLLGRARTPWTGVASLRVAHPREHGLAVVYESCALPFTPLGHLCYAGPTNNHRLIRELGLEPDAADFGAL